MNRILIIISLLVAISIVQSCEKPERTTLNEVEKEILDSIYADQVSSTRKQADSICKAQYQSIFNHTVDSLKEIYVREIEAIINEGE